MSKRGSSAIVGWMREDLRTKSKEIKEMGTLHRGKEFWEETLREYDEYEGSQISFCESKGIAASSLKHHLYKREGKPGKKKPKSFTPVAIETSSRSGEMILELPHGVRLRVSL